MAKIRIDVRVSFHGGVLKVTSCTAMSVEPRRVFLEDEETGERFVITTRVLGIRALAEAAAPADTKRPDLRAFQRRS
jgi:hypothetical protein